MVAENGSRVGAMQKRARWDDPAWDGPLVGLGSDSTFVLG